VTEPDDQAAASVWQNLRRRKVVQWGLAYAAAAWALLQGLEYITNTFHWPERIQQLTSLALLAGLPVAVVIAWYHGDRGNQRVTRVEVALVCLLLVLGCGLVWWWDRMAAVPVAPGVAGERATARAPAPVPVDDRSIAVLPFVNMSSDPEQEYFSDGLSEELLDMLAKIPQLRVIGRTSSFQYKGRNEDLRVIGERLGVAHLLEGSVRRSGSQVRITAQLIRAADGSHLWSETYDRRLEDIFAVQHEIAQQVADALQVVLARDASAKPSRAATGNMTAYDVYLEGRYLFNTRTIENFGRAIELLQVATERDPEFAEAQATLALAIIISRDYPGSLASGGVIPLTQAERAAERALEINPSLADAEAALGMIDASRLEWRDAEGHFRKAIEVEPYNGMVSMWYGNFLRGLGRLRDSVAFYETAQRFDPQAAVAIGNLAIVYAATGREADAMRLVDLAQERGMRHPTFCIARLTVGIRRGAQPTVEAAMADWMSFFPGWLPAGAERVLAQAAFDPAARPEARRVLLDAMQDERNLAAWGTLLVAAIARDFDTAFAAADAGLPSTGGSWGVALWNPGAAEWRADRRFRRLVERLQMPAYWRETSWPDACRPLGKDDFECD
jgi:TolB-like protein